MTDEFEFDVMNEEVEPEIRMAPQDRPWPKDKLPQGTTIVSDEQARLVINHIAFRPSRHTLGDTALDTEGEWSDRHATILIREMWNGLRPGATLFVRPDFPVKPDAPSKRAHLEGYKQFTK